MADSERILKKRNCVVIFIFFFFTTMMIVSGDISSTVANEQTTEKFDLLPEGWEIFCSNKNDKARSDVSFRMDYKCVIDSTSSGLWNLETLRNWTDNFQVNYTVDIECIEGSNISLPWPMKAMHLIELKVTDCVVEDYFKDFGNPMLDSTPDQLIVLDMSNIQVIVRLSEMLAVANTIDTINKDYQCGSEDTVERFISRNITYGFHNEIMSGMSSDRGLEIMQAGDRFLSKTRNIPYNCVYKRLTYYDQSISASKAKLFMELSTDKSRYPELRFYNLSRIGVDRVHQQVQRWYHYFDKLEYMDLSRNKITELQFEDSAKGNDGDIPDFTLDLSYNKISEITASHIQRLSDIPNLFIDLKGNPINCSCNDEVKQLLKLIHNNNIWKKESYRRYEYTKMLQCNEPITLQGKTLISITENDLQCEIDVEYVVDYASIIGLSVFALFLIVIIIVLAKFRREIRILTYTRFHIILPCQSELLYENKSYDAFVSYSSADQDWVSKTFEDIEESGNESMKKFKFCLHHRDFIPGKTIFDNVIDSVETSRHTVIVLSRNFLNSHYCMYEFHEAFQQSIIERKKHLIVILLEDIPTNELPKDLKRCLKTFTYIRKDDLIFEDRLVFALSYKSNKRLTSRSDSESTSRTVNSQISRETDVTSDGNMSPSVISTDSVFPPIITTNDFLGKTEKCENHV